MRNDRHAFVDRGANAAHVIPMVMHRDDMADRLAGNEFFRLRDHRQGSCLAIWRVNEHDVIFHPNRQTMMSTARQPENAIGDLLRSDVHWRHRRSAIAST